MWTLAYQLTCEPWPINLHVNPDLSIYTRTLTYQLTCEPWPINLHVNPALSTYMWTLPTCSRSFSSETPAISLSPSSSSRMSSSSARSRSSSLSHSLPAQSVDKTLGYVKLAQHMLTDTQYNYTCKTKQLLLIDITKQFMIIIFPVPDSSASSSTNSCLILYKKKHFDYMH